MSSKARMFSVVILLAGTIFLRDSAFSYSPTVPTNVGDLVIHHARIYTLDDHMPWAEAIVIKSGRIVEIGRNELATQEVAAGLRKIDLKGRLVLPGFIDSHDHCDPMGTLGSLGLVPHIVPLNDAGSVEEIQKRLAARVKESDKGSWIIGAALNTESLAGRWPTRYDLDRAAPQNPVWVWIEGHGGVGNSIALDKAGITADTPDPPGGRIVRDPVTSQPTGLLKERPGRLVRRAMGREQPLPDDEARKYGFHLILEEAASRGITSIQNDYQPELEPLILAALTKGTLSVRWTFWPYYPWFDDSEWSEPQDLERYRNLLNARKVGTGEFVKGGFLKLGVDGTVALGTAVLLEPYTDELDNRGLMTFDPIGFQRAVQALDAAGFQLAVHAVGDGGVRMAIDAIEHAIRQNPARERRHRIEHGIMVSPEDIRRCSRLGIILSTQPSWVLYWPKTWERRLGRDRARRMMPLKSAVREGVTVILNGDDAPGHPLGELKLAVMGSVSGRKPAIWDARERLSIKEAIRAVTYNPAYADFEENRRGSLRKGYLGDLVVLSHDIVDGSPADLAQAKIEATVVGGRIVYADWEFSWKILREQQ